MSALAAVRPPLRVRVLRWASWTAGAAAVLAVLGVIAVVVIVPAAAGGTARTVQSGSMAPALEVGSLVIDRPADPDTLRVGDIATYQQTVGAGARLVTHRIVRVAGAHGHRVFVFRGDANLSADPAPVRGDAIRGKVWFDVPMVGALRDRVARLRWVLIGLGVLGLGWYSVWQIAGGLRERRDGR